MSLSVDNCPHCGGPGKLKTIAQPYMHGWVGCPECGIYKQWSYDPYQAILKWNQRADCTEEAALREQIKKAMAQPIKGGRKRRNEA